LENRYGNKKLEVLTDDEIHEFSHVLINDTIFKHFPETDGYKDICGDDECPFKVDKPQKDEKTN
jgi:hypothetical protein